jgi:toxin ParE1/3/4
MPEYRLSNSAKEDLIRIHHFGVEKFGITQADKYFDSFFDYFEVIAHEIEAVHSGYTRPDQWSYYRVSHSNSYRNNRNSWKWGCIHLGYYEACINSRDQRGAGLSAQEFFNQFA